MLGHNYIGTEHLLLALLREGEGVGAQILKMLVPDSEESPYQMQLRTAVLDTIGYKPPSEADRIDPGVVGEGETPAPGSLNRSMLHELIEQQELITAALKLHLLERDQIIAEAELAWEQARQDAEKDTARVPVWKLKELVQRIAAFREELANAVRAENGMIVALNMMPYNAIALDVESLLPEEQPPGDDEDHGEPGLGPRPEPTGPDVD